MGTRLSRSASFQRFLFSIHSLSDCQSVEIKRTALEKAAAQMVSNVWADGLLPRLGVRVGRNRALPVGMHVGDMFAKRV